MPPKVLQICAVDFTVKNFLLPLIRHLEQQGFEVHTLCSRGEFFPILEQQGLRLHALTISRSMNLFSHLRATIQLYSFLRRNRFQIVHTHTPIASVIGRVAARLARVPVILYTAHGFYFHERMHPLWRRFHIGLERFAAHFCDFIFTQSEEDRQTAIGEKICAAEKIMTIGNGVNLERFDPEKVAPARLEALREEFQLPPDAPLVGIIGRLVREKGFFEFFQAASLVLKAVPECRFLVIGDQLKSDYDSSKEELYKLIEDLAIRDNIVFAGMRSDIPELLRLVNVYTLPSYREGMPRSIIEAMAMGRPVVATNIRGAREEILDGETGFLVPVGESKPLADALLTLLQDPERAKQMGTRARQRALELFDEQYVLQRQRDVYERLIKRKSLK